MLHSTENSTIKHTKESLKKVQQIGLEILLEVDRICRKYGIAYELDGGTLLGAVRHKGFIPWDDDVDIRFLRDEYDKFCKVCKTELDKERFFLQNYHTDPEYRWGYAKILRKGTVAKRYHQEMIHSKNGVMIDIMPCENMPERGISKGIYNLRCFLARKCSYSPIGAKYENNIIKRCIYKLMSKIPKKVFVKEFERLAYKYNDKQTKLVRSPGWGWKQESIGNLREWMEDRIEMEFEGHMLPVPRDYDGFLRFLYGENYMTPPPLEKQVPELALTYLDLGNGLVLKGE